MPLFVHAAHAHTPRNVNQVHQDSLDWRLRFCVKVTKLVGTFECACVFAGLGVGSIIGALTGNMLLAIVCGYTSSYFLQLVLLAIIMIGQDVASRHSELLAEEMYHTTLKSGHDLEQIRQHLDAQDAVLLALQEGPPSNRKASRS